MSEEEVDHSKCPCGIPPELFPICSAGTCGVCRSSQAVVKVAVEAALANADLHEWAMAELS